MFILNIPTSTPSQGALAEEETGGGAAAVPRPGGAEGVVPSQDVRQVNSGIIKSDNINIKCWIRPGHGAPTKDIRKKKFTEHQMNCLTRSQSLFGLDTDLPSPSPTNITRYDSQPAIDQAVSGNISALFLLLNELFQLLFLEVSNGVE